MKAAASWAITLTFLVSAQVEARGLETYRPGEQIIAKDTGEPHQIVKVMPGGVWVRTKARRGAAGALAGEAAGANRTVLTFIPRDRIRGVDPFCPLKVGGGSTPAQVVEMTHRDIAALKRAAAAPRAAAAMFVLAIQRQAEVKRARDAMSDPALREVLGRHVGRLGLARRAVREAALKELRSDGQGDLGLAIETYRKVEQLLAGVKAAGGLPGEVRDLELLKAEVAQRVHGKAGQLPRDVNLRGAVGDAVRAREALWDDSSDEAAGMRQALAEAEEEARELEDYRRLRDHRDLGAPLRPPLPPRNKNFGKSPPTPVAPKQPADHEADMLEAGARLEAQGAEEAVARNQAKLRQAQQALTRAEQLRLLKDPVGLAKDLYARGEAYERALRQLPSKLRDGYRRALRRIAKLLERSRALRADRPTESAAALTKKITEAERAGLTGLAKQLRAERRLAASD